jgi:molybdopterin synthase sulfur carrier subunit
VPVIWIPALLLPISEGRQKVNVPGDTIRQVIDNLELEYPGISKRLLDGSRLRPNISVVVDGFISQDKLRHKLEDHSEVQFIPAISGG